jgi:predicted SAM-dependent methyltransferase
MSLRKIINKVLRHTRLELKRLPPKITPTYNIHDSIWIAETANFKNYHIGCGSILAKGYLNIDDAPMGGRYQFHEHKIYEAKEMSGAYILKHDLSQGLPAHAGSLNKIYHSHFLEHLSRTQGLTFIKDCFRTLSEGGAMRFAIPNFRLWCENYINRNDHFFSWYRKNFLPVDEYHFHTHSQIFTGMLFNHGHQMAYDFESLSFILDKVGFKNITLAEWGVSSFFEELQVLESHDSERRHESLILECFK